MASTPRLITPIGGAPVDGSAVTFTWDAVSGARDYRLHIAGDDAFEQLVCALETGPTTLLTLLDMLPRDGSVFHWRVQALTAAGWQPWSSAEHFKAQTDQHVVASRTKQEAAVGQDAPPGAATPVAASAPTAAYQRGHTSKATMALFLAMMLVTFAATFASIAYIVFSAR